MNAESHSTLPPSVEAALAVVPARERTALVATWHQVADLAPPGPPLDAARAARLRAALLAQAIEVHAKDRPARPARRRNRRAGMWAATLVGLVALAVWAWQPTVVTVAPGATQVVALPDGSQVDLNAGARLAYRPLFGTLHRHLRLEGVAFFDVVAGGQAFIVETFNAEATVLGTQFEVQALATETRPRTTVRLASGRLQLAPLSRPEAAVVLAAGEQSTVVVQQAPTPSETSGHTAVTWRVGAVRFEDATLAEIFATLERRYAVEIEVETPALLSQRLTYIDQKSLDAEALLYELCQIQGLRYRRTALRRYLVYAPSNAES